jgi:hypothetical protein
MVGRPITVGNLQWTGVVKNFSEQWKALETKKSSEEPEVPKITKALPVIKWTEAFGCYLHRVVGVRKIPLAYVIRPEVAVPVIGTIAAGAPHLTDHGSIEVKMIERAQYNHPLYAKTIPPCIISSKKPQGQPPMPPQSGHSSERRMAEEHGSHCQTSTVGMTSGKQRLNGTNNSSTRDCGRVRAIFHSTSSLLNT